jgi:ubiquinone/menaquinone biosynthesis C-methylase UbiE
MIFVGGNFEEAGEEFKKYFIELGGLRQDERILEVGCGIGRMAVPLTSYVSREGEYWGFDIVKVGIEWCREKISSRFGNFHFQYVDVRNKNYNPLGAKHARDFRFPFEDQYFDFVLVTSVFTHMLPSDVENYLSEISRVLRVDGRCLITFFLLNAESEDLIRAGRSTWDFRHRIDGCLTVDEINPEAAIAYNEGLVRKLLANCGLRIIAPIHYGSWCQRDAFLSYQDIVVARKEKVIQGK